MAYNIASLRRRLETVIAENQRARSYWQDLSGDGFRAANTLVNTVIQSRYADEPVYWHPLLCQEFSDIVATFAKKMDTIIEGHYAKLKGLVEKMDKQYTKMQQQAKEIAMIRQRAIEIQVHHMPFYKTCTIDVFVERLTAIVAMYGAAMKTIKSLLESKGFLDISDRQEAMSLLSIWLNHPSLDKVAIQEFEDLCQIEMHV